MPPRCHNCNHIIYGEANCIVCSESFKKMTSRQVICRKKSCKSIRAAEAGVRYEKSISQAAFYIKTRQSIICCVCDKRVTRTRKNQVTCGRRWCIKTQNGNAAKYKVIIDMNAIERAKEDGRRYVGQI